MDINKFKELFSAPSFNIIGFSKCGTVALRDYLVSLGRKAYATELIYRKDGFERFDRFNELNGNPWKAVVITRNNVERIWSAYHYWPHFWRVRSFEEFLDFKDEQWQSVGVNDPIRSGDYQYWIEKWKEKVPDIITVRLEDIKHLFPKKNATSHKPAMPHDYKLLVLERLQYEGIPVELEDP